MGHGSPEIPVDDLLNFQAAMDWQKLRVQESFSFDKSRLSDLPGKFPYAVLFRPETRRVGRLRLIFSPMGPPGQLIAKSWRSHRDIGLQENIGQGSNNRGSYQKSILGHD